MNITRRSAIVAGASLVAGASWSQALPNKPITLVVPFAPGGNADIVARSIALPYAKLLGQSVVVDNRGGGGGAIGTAIVSKAPADGATLLAATPGQLGTLPHMFKTPYKLEDFVPIGVLSKTSIAVVVRKGDARFKTVEEFIAYARANPDKLNVGHAGPGSPNHLAMLQFENAANCRFTPVAYKGSGPALIDMLAGTIDVMFDQVSSSLPHLKSGTLTTLVVLGPTRDAAVPDTRSLKEAGLPEFDASTYIGLLAPKGVAASVVAALTEAAQKVASDPAFDRGLKAIGSGAHYEDPKRFAEILKADETLAVSLVKQGRLVNE
ncbi:tripartite tricarboxylate transporter substrate binding protein [Variovorax guangxiensis]|uniref:Bug family tripartite tricarboxylate transporter substrate binding protein n=1 Tax=Variovorax guangxiensis TaxID=1775474 RepID=UPI002861A74B|nr:tripartite tricarboxylate transporter substrate binding protein [Variovorax guangxiensis]MDR6854849.1 tripartite-type tricarboxylate transporter receptor subunit TctC [Variovorax guangxiensis]